MRKRIIGGIAGLVLAAVWSLPAFAQEWLGTFEDWNAFQFTEGGRRVCYISSTPLDMEPKNVTRGEVYMQVTHDGRNRTRDVVSVTAGYVFAQGSVAEAAIGPTVFRMFTNGDSAWNPTPQQDSAMVRALVSGSRLTIAGESTRGTETRDIYSLLGFTAAHTAINEACRG